VCPEEPEHLVWEFGEFRAGEVVDVTQPMLSELRTRFQTLGAREALAGPSTLPAGVRFILDLTDPTRDPARITPRRRGHLYRYLLLPG